MNKHATNQTTAQMIKLILNQAHMSYKHKKSKQMLKKNRVSRNGT